MVAARSGESESGEGNENEGEEGVSGSSGAQKRPRRGEERVENVGAGSGCGVGCGSTRRERQGRLEKKELIGRPNLSADERGEGEGMAGWASIQEEKGGCAAWIGPCTPKERGGKGFSLFIFQIHFSNTFSN